MPNESIHIDEKLLRLVYEVYPAPLANPFVRLAAELRKLHPDWDRAFNRCIDCFEISVKFMGLAATAAYIRSACVWKTGQRNAAAESSILRLRQNDKLSTGHWVELLRNTLGALQEGNDCMSLLARRYYERAREKTGGRTLRDAIDSIPNVRNKYKGHAKIMAPELYHEVLIEIYHVLERWYGALEFFDRVWLAAPETCEPFEGKFQIELELRRGNHNEYLRRCVTSTQELRRRRLYLIEDPGEEDLTDQPLLLHPFAIVDPEAAGEPGDVLLFEAYSEKETKYDCRRNGQVFSTAAFQTDFLDSIGPVLSSHGHLAGMPMEVYQFIKEFSDRTRQQSLKFVERVEKQKTYQPELQVAREDTETTLREFLESDKSALIISGQSGIGKTCFVCRYAQEVLGVEDGETLVLLMGADSLPQSDISLERTVREALGSDKPVRDWALEVRKRFRKHGCACRLVVIVDGIDKHPNIAAVLHAIDQWVKNVAADVPELKLIVTCSPTGLDRARDEIATLAFERYYTPVREILAGDSGAIRLPAIQMGAFTDAELKLAYQKYLAAGFRPTTTYEELEKMPSARRALAYPLFMRLVTEAYQNEEVPPNPISFQTLQKYCKLYAFADRRRKAFVDSLVDRMLRLGVREISGRQISEDPALREDYLESGATFDQLVRDQVLSTYQRVKSRFPTPIEEDYVEFAMDRVFQFLLVVRLLDNHGSSPEVFLSTELKQALDRAREFPSLRSGLIDLLGEVARNSLAPRAQKAAVFAGVCGLSNNGSDEWIMDLLSDVLVSLAEESTREPAEEESGDAAPGTPTEEDPFHMVIAVVLERLGENGLRLFTATAEDLFHRSLWQTAIDLLRRLAKPGNLNEQSRFSLQNQLVVVLKNQDKWDEAMAYSDLNEGLLQEFQKGGSAPPRLRARHWLNRFSVLYDKGHREVAYDLCLQANQIAREHGLKLEEAATANNLGIAEVYFDRPRTAEETLTQGIAAAGAEYDIVAGHNYLDRGLVRMVRWQLQGGLLLCQAEEDIHQAYSRFQKMEYGQGVLYAHASQGLIEQYKAMALKASFEATPQPEWSSHPNYQKCLDGFQKASDLMQLGLRLARQLGEDWPDYGIQADMALWRLKHPVPNLDDALTWATGAHELIGGDEGFDRDPEGASIIAMVLARVLLDRHEDPDRVWKLLKEAELQFNSLKFYSAAARAAAGLVEAAPLCGKDPAPYEDCRRGHLEKFMPGGEFPPDFAAKFEPMDWKLLFLAELF